MERLTIPDVILDRGVIQRSIIDAKKVKECAMDLYWRLKAVEDAIADEESEEYDLDRLRELVEADRQGRCYIKESVLSVQIKEFYSDQLIDAVIGEQNGRPKGHADPVGPEGTPGVKFVCLDETSDMTEGKWKWLMNRFLKGEPHEKETV